MLMPFSRRSKPWETTAITLRRLGGVGDGALLDPWELAPKVGLRVIDGTSAVGQLEKDERRHLLGAARWSWSGGVYPRPLPDGSYICILNPSHSNRRQKITLMEEVVHVYLKHDPSGLALLVGGVQVREYRKAHEEEAYGVGAAALIPWAALFPVLNQGRSIEELAEAYDVTPELVSYRIKITGAFRLYQARQSRQA